MRTTSFSAEDLSGGFRDRRAALDARAENLDARRWRDAQVAKTISTQLWIDWMAAPLTPAERRGVTINDRALLIYTSGTTGLPKAASISHRRILNWGGWFAGLTDASPEDRLFDCLPLFHSVGGIVAPCSMLTAGASVVLSDKFSVGPFWHDIVRWDCTLFQYIGELCRYLLKAPPSEFESRHRLRLACGNGLRGDIWEAFQARFCHSADTGVLRGDRRQFLALQCGGQAGRDRPDSAAAGASLSGGDRSCRRRAWRCPFATPDGLCIPCARGEVGEAIGRIGTADDGGGRFEGYTDAAETEKKVLRDVLAKGDAWFRTGDLMMLDEGGYFHFVDRIGDTFRWKGENVATSEVNEAVVDCPGVVDATTYGVEIPGADGRAGMVAIVVDDRFDLAGIQRSSFAPAAGLCLPGFRPHLRDAGYHRNLQAEEAGSDARGVRSAPA